MTQQIINVGTNPNDGTGDTLRSAFIKTDDNFTELYSDKENTANKSATTTLGTSNVLFPTQNAVKTYVDNGLSTKQNTLISGTNIKTINSTSLLGSGNVSVQPTLVSGTNIKTINGNSILGSGDLTISSGITGSGTDNYIPRFNGTTALENSSIFDDGTNVGIGTSSPVTKLDLGSSTGQKLSIYASGNDRAGFGMETSTLRYYTPTNSIHSFGHLSNSDGVTFSERMRIDSDGNIGIGTSTPSTLLDVNGIISATGGNSTDWNAKQENLVSGTNIKTLNGNSVLGSGDLSTKGIHTLVKPAVGETTSFLLYAQTIGNVVGQANRLTAVPYIPATTITCSSLYINVTTALAGSNARILIYSDDNGKPGTKIYESANLDCSTTGIKTATTTQTFEAGTIYWICSHSSSTQSFSSANQGALIPINVSGISVFTSYYITPTFGSAPTTFGTGTFIQLAIPFIGIKI